MGANNLFYKKRDLSVIYIILVIILLLIFGRFLYLKSSSKFTTDKENTEKTNTKVVNNNGENKEMTKNKEKGKEKSKEDGKMENKIENKTLEENKNGVKMIEKNKNSNLPVWNLNDLYSGIDDPNIKNDLDSLEKRIKKFSRLYRGKIFSLTGYELFKALIEYEGINELASKITSFAFLNYVQDLLIEENASFYQNTNEQITKLLSNILFFEVEINNLENDVIREKLNSSGKLVKFYGEYIKNVRLFRQHQLALNLEQYSLEKSVSSRDAWSRLFDETVSGLEFNFDNKILNESEILDVLNNNKSDSVRRRAGKVFGDVLEKNIKLFAFITNILAKDKEINDEWRKYKTPISAMNLHNKIEDDVVENLYETVQENYSNISHRYYKLKAKMLGKGKLYYTDRNAPLQFSDEKVYTWEEAVDIVLNACRDFSPKMAEVGQLFFDNNWIDVPNRKGKRDGAFAHPTVPLVHPYILLNFQGTRRDVLTLAHELGHGIHMYLSKTQGYFMSETPLTLAETASVFGEQLTFRYILKNETDKNKKISLLASAIEDKINTSVRQIAFLEFEKNIHNERKNGEIAEERINEIWLESQKKALGDVFTFGDEYKYYWAYVPHFIHSPFYVYSYAFGDGLVNTLYSLYMREPDGFADKYVELLSAGGSKNYKELLKPFNLNPKNKDFWQEGLNLIAELIDELEELLK